MSSLLASVCCLALTFNGVLCAEVNLEGRINELEKLVERQNVVNKALKARAEDLEGRLDQLKNLECQTSGSDSNVRGDIGNVNEVTGLMDHTHKRQQIAEGKHVAFHAYQNITRAYYTHEPIKFDVEVVDEPTHGSHLNGYSPNEGIFDAPMSGVYVFTWTVTALRSGVSFTTELLVGGVPVTSTTSDSDFTPAGSGNGVHPSTAVYVTSVSAGEHVSVRVLHTSSTPVFVKSDTEVRATFSGWLLF